MTTPGRIFHLAIRADWVQAQAEGRYTTSTRGRTLAEEGFIHASRGDQWRTVRERFYADVTEPLLLLVLDPDRLTSPVVDEAVPDSDERFPHVYGPIDLEAVVEVIALPAPGAPVGGAALSAVPRPHEPLPDRPPPTPRPPRRTPS